MTVNRERCVNGGEAGKYKESAKFVTIKFIITMGRCSVVPFILSLKASKTMLYIVFLYEYIPKEIYKNDKLRIVFPQRRISLKRFLTVW